MFKKKQKEKKKQHSRPTSYIKTMHAKHEYKTFLALFVKGKKKINQNKNGDVLQTWHAVFSAQRNKLQHK